MKVQFGMIVTQGSGKLGGHVFTKGRNGNNVRTKIKPINRRTSSQVNQRSSLTSQSQVWRTLTDSQRAQWLSIGGQFTFHNNFGQRYHPSGKNYFMKINENLLQASAAAVTTPPLTTPATAQTALTATSTGANLVGMTFAASPVPAGMALLVFATRGLSAGVSFVGKQYRYIGKIAAAATTPQDLTTIYTTKFGAPVSGSRVFLQVKVVNITTGQESIPLQASVIIT